MSFQRSLSPRRRGAGIHDFNQENGFQIKFGMTKIAGLRFFAYGSE